MNSNEFNQVIEGISIGTDIVILLTLLTFELWLFYKLKFNVDRSGIVTLLIHLIVSIFRVMRSIFELFSIL